MLYIPNLDQNLPEVGCPTYCDPHLKWDVPPNTNTAKVWLKYQLRPIPYKDECFVDSYKTIFLNMQMPFVKIKFL